MAEDKSNPATPQPPNRPPPPQLFGLKPIASAAGTPAPAATGAAPAPASPTPSAQGVTGAPGAASVTPPSAPVMSPMAVALAAGKAATAPLKAKKSLFATIPLTPVLLTINSLLILLVIAFSLIRRPLQTVQNIENFELGQPSVPATEDQRSIIVSEPPKALSWQAAEATYSSGDFAGAANIYGKLIEVGRDRMVEKNIIDLLQLRLGQCLRHMRRVSESATIFSRCAQSSSPIIRAVACNEQGLVEYSQGKYMSARMWAYMALGMLGALDQPSPLEADCDYLAGIAITTRTVGFMNEISWLGPTEITPHDPFVGRDELSLQDLINQGADKSGQPVLAPRITRLGAASYSVMCTQASLEDVMNRFSSESASEIEWSSVDMLVRTRLVTLVFKDISGSRFQEIACGATGLIARLEVDSTGKPRTVIYDPVGGQSVAQEKKLLCDETISNWRRFVLRYPDDTRVAEGRLAMAAIADGSGETALALQEYQLVATQYPKNPSAPSSLLMSSRLRIRLMDYAGAKIDLRNLIDRYPQYGGVGEALLSMGRLSYDEGQYDRAISDYVELKTRDVSPYLSAMAALGAGLCYYELREYKDAIGWLEEFSRRCDDIPDAKDRYDGFFALGQSYVKTGSIENVAKSLDAYQRAMACEPPSSGYIDVVIAMAGAYFKIGSYGKAIGILNNLERKELSDSQTFNAALQYARCLRAMGLTEDACTTLIGKKAIVSGKNYRALLGWELAGCYSDQGDYERACKELVEALPNIPDGIDYQKATCELGNIYVELGESRQAVTVLEGLLKSKDLPVDLERSARKLLASAYAMLGEFRRAEAAMNPASTAKAQEENE